MKHYSIAPSLAFMLLLFTFPLISQTLYVETDSGEAGRFESTGISSWLALANSGGLNSYLWAANNDTYIDNRGIGGSLGLRGNAEITMEIDFQKALVIDSDLEVGIGTTIPKADLHIEGNGNILRLEGTQPWISFYDDGVYEGWVQAKENELSMGAHNGNGTDLALYAGGLKAIKIDGANNNIGIYDNTPEARLSIVADTDGLDVGQRSGNFIGYLNVQRPLSADGTNVIARFRDGGSTTVALEDHDAFYQITVMGDAFASGGMWTNSDKRLKKDIQVLEGSLDKVMQLKPSSYKYNTSEKYPFLGIKDEVRIGFIAQELEEVFPEAVRSSTFIDADGEEPVSHELYAVNYQSLIPVLTKAIQEQQATLNALQTELESMSLELTNVKAQLSAQEK